MGTGADAALGVDEAVEARLPAAVVTGGTGGDATLGVDETADIDIAISKIGGRQPRTSDPRRKALRGFSIWRVTTCRSLADEMERFHTAVVAKRTRQSIQLPS